MKTLSIVIPNLNDGSFLERLLKQLAYYRPSPGWEVIVVDAGSSDHSLDVAQMADIVIDAEPGRAVQLAAGVAQSSGSLLWFLHADSELSPEVCLSMNKKCANTGIGWGRFDVELLSSNYLLVLVARMMNLRSRLTGICTGDQGIFVDRELLESIGGIPQQQLMEDIELSRLLKNRCKPDCRREVLRTSARRWLDNGAIRTILLMWYLRAAYYFGVRPERLAAAYYKPSS
ncbi:MAG: TIGR04283 family arsenosugar biosynthesis glycosyltransferase [Pseudomonadales bacterium]|nr:TIGR04283 family arsenosugar biosynthesis glycosyltransferase [Pseudomonadales bacterium]